MKERLKSIDLTRIRTAVAANKQFVVVLVVALLALAFWRGTPGRSLFDDVRAQRDVPVVTPATPLTPEERREIIQDLVEALSPTPAPEIDFDAPNLPPAPDETPAPRCDSTAPVEDLLNPIRSQLSAALGAPVPGDALLELAKIAAGCSDTDPTGPVIDLALEFAPLVPDTGLPPIDLPDIPGIPPIPVPDELIAALGPVAGAIHDGCENVALISLLLVVLPPAISSPIGSSDLIQFLAPVSTFCGLFDESDPSGLLPT